MYLLQKIFVLILFNNYACKFDIHQASFINISDKNIAKMSGVSAVRKGVCLVAGAGPGIGQSVANRFAKESKISKMKHCSKLS